MSFKKGDKIISIDIIWFNRFDYKLIIKKTPNTVLEVYEDSYLLKFGLGNKDFVDKNYILFDKKSILEYMQTEANNSLVEVDRLLYNYKN